MPLQAATKGIMMMKIPDIKDIVALAKTCTETADIIEEYEAMFNTIDRLYQVIEALMADGVVSHGWIAEKSGLSLEDFRKLQLSIMNARDVLNERGQNGAEAKN